MFTKNRASSDTLQRKQGLWQRPGEGNPLCSLSSLSSVAETCTKFSFALLFISLYDICHRHGTWKRRRVYNEGRASAVRRWMLNVLGREYLFEGGCLDIAGGKGELSFEIMNLNGVMSTVIDPRPLDLYRFKRKLEFGFYHRNDVLGSYNHLPAPQRGDIPRLPNHIRGFFEMFESGAMEGHVPVVKKKKEEEEEKEEEEDLDSFVYPLILRDSEAFDSGLEVGQSIAWSTKVSAGILSCGGTSFLVQHSLSLENDSLSIYIYV